MSKRLGVLTGLLLAATLLYASSTPISGTENHMYVAQVNGGTNITVEAAMFQPDRSDVQPESELCNALSEGAIYMNTTSHTLRFCNASAWGDIGSFGASSGTLNTVAKFTPNGTTLGNSSITDDGTVVTVNTATTIRAAGIDSDTGFLDTTGILAEGAKGWTLNVTPSADTDFSGAARFYIHDPGNPTVDSSVLTLINDVSGTAVGGPWSDGNYGAFIKSFGTGLTNIGSHSQSLNATGSNYGVMGDGRGVGTSVNVGGYFYGQGGANPVGVMGVLGTTSAPNVSAAGLFDNNAAAASIAIFRDNGVEAVSVEDGAAVSSTRGFFNVTGTLPTTGFPGGAFFNITTAGTANSQNGIEVLLKPGFTGSGKTMAGYFENTVLGTSTYIGNANVSLYANTLGVGAGFGTGISSQSSGSTAYNTGSYNQGGTGTGTTGLGGYFVGAGATNSIGLFAMIGTGAQIQPATSAVAILDNAAVAAPIAIFRDNSTALPTTGAAATWAILDGAIPQYGLGVLTSATMAASTQAYQTQSTSSYTWTNAQVVALGASFTGDITVATLPAKTQVLDAAIVITGQAAGVTTLTVSCGDAIAGTPFINYIVPSDAKATVNTFYGDAVAERGTSLDVEHYYLPSYTATTLVTCHFISTVQNLDQTTGSTGRVILTTRLLP